MRRAALLLALALACGGGGLARVEQATTAAQEREAFAALARGGVGFSAHDVAGATVDMSQPKWWERTHRIVLRAHGRTLDHVLIDRANVLALMQE